MNSASVTKRKTLSLLNAGDVSQLVQWAWEDRTSFETIFERTGLRESDVIVLMRKTLTRRSFEMWRARMHGRTTKHRALRPAQMKHSDHAVADHRRPHA